MLRPTSFSVDPTVYAYLEKLYATDPGAVDRIDDLLDVLENDCQDLRVRARAWAPPGSGRWGFTVAGKDTHTVIWTLHPLTSGEVEVFVAGIVPNLSRGR